MCLYTLDSCNCRSQSCIYRTHPEEGGDQKFTSAQVCARSLSRREWHQLCQLQLVVFTVPSLPTFCYYFTDTLRFLPHSPLPRLSRETTKDVKNPFLASSFAILTCRGSSPQSPSLSASHCLSFSLTLLASRDVEGSFLQTYNLSPADVWLCRPFSCLYSCLGGSTPFPILSASSGASLCHLDPVWESSPLPTLHLDLKNGDLYLPFSASNCFTLCHDPLDGNFILLRRFSPSVCKLEAQKWKWSRSIFGIELRYSVSQLAAHQPLSWL